MVMVNTDFIGTIADDEEVPVDESSESDDDAVAVVKRKQKKSGAKEFNSEFTFEDNFADVGFAYDPLKYVKKKKKPASTLDEKIFKARSERKKKTQEDEVDEIETTVGDGNISEDSDLDETKTDRVRAKESRKKKSVNSEPEKQKFEESIDTYDEKMTFADMNLSRPLVKALSTMNFVQPTPIQSACIPVALKGRDLCACAVTGSGKTAAFMLPILERLLYKPKSQPMSRVLVLVPTRELAVQVHQVTKTLSQYTKVSAVLAAGGLDIKMQEAALRLGPDIVIATPGRLIDHLHNAPSFSLANIEILVLDEADRMLDEYFAEQMKEVIRLCSLTRQTMLFSATMTEEVKDLAAVSLNKPVKVFVNSSTDLAMNLRQEFVRIRPNKEGDREAIVSALVKRTFNERCMVFIQTKVQAHRMHIVLGLLGINVGEIHGNLSQMQRLEALRRFKDGEIDVLLATDVAARGLDIHDVKTVINFTMPSTIQHYVHRVGRTARAGRSGRSITLVGEKERRILKDIVKKAANPVKSRVLPPDIIDKYVSKIRSLEDDVQAIVTEEEEEKQLAKAENYMNKTQRLLAEGDNDQKRSWFQEHEERQLVKRSQTLGSDKAILGGFKDKKGKSKSQRKRELTAEDRANYEIMKSQAYAARVAKRSNRQPRIRTVVEDEPQAKKPRKKGGAKQSSFEAELTNVGRKSVKGLRYKAHEARKEMKKMNKKPVKRSQSKSKGKVHKIGKKRGRR
ncbi:probable ATP-dependent RNA helicase DDX27 [Watersipora subatra]|uniref:probable ATP-dependent RNA helicase DDX27 n=1 Tax=Watersipora subatra TaxID=2589382 RepID=UPI00355BDE04